MLSPAATVDYHTRRQALAYWRKSGTKRPQSIESWVRSIDADKQWDLRDASIYLVEERVMNQINALLPDNLYVHSI